MGFSVAAPIIGDFLSFIGNEHTNDTNYNIAAANRVWQSKEDQKQRDFEIEQWEREMAYNTPFAQRQRYQDAGLNPFLTDSTKIDSGKTAAPSAPPLTSPPATPTMIPPSFSGLQSMAALDIQRSQMEANSANQTAQMVNTFMEAAMKAYSDGKESLGNKIIDFGLGFVGRFTKDSSLTKQMMQFKVKGVELDNRIKSVEASIQESLGFDKANQVIKNMQAEYDKTVENTKLFQTIENLNDANVKLVNARTSRERSEIHLNIARYKALLNQAYRDFAMGGLYEAKTLSEDQLRQYWVSMTQKKALMLGMEYEESEAEFEFNELPRAFKKTKTGKYQNMWNFNVDSDNAPIFKTLKSIFETAGGFFGSKRLSLPPTKHSRTGMDGNEWWKKEWYEYSNEY